MAIYFKTWCWNLGCQVATLIFFLCLLQISAPSQERLQHLLFSNTIPPCLTGYLDTRHADIHTHRHRHTRFMALLDFVQS